MMYWSPLAVHSPHSNTPEKYCERTSVPKDLAISKTFTGRTVACSAAALWRSTIRWAGCSIIWTKHKMRENTLDPVCQ